MKVTILFLFVPILAFSSPSSISSLKSIMPEQINLGLDYKSLSHLYNNRTDKLSEVLTSYHLKRSSLNLGNTKIMDAFINSENGIIKSLSLVFDKPNGIKFRNNIIKKIGEPVAEMVDNYQWTVDGVLFEIRETEKGYVAIYKNSN